MHCAMAWLGRDHRSRTVMVCRQMKPRRHGAHTESRALRGRTRCMMQPTGSRAARGGQSCERKLRGSGSSLTISCLICWCAQTKIASARSLQVRTSGKRSPGTTFRAWRQAAKGGRKASVARSFAEHPTRCPCKCGAETVTSSATLALEERAIDLSTIAVSNSTGSGSAGAFLVVRHGGACSKG